MCYSAQSPLPEIIETGQKLLGLPRFCSGIREPTDGTQTAFINIKGNEKQKTWCQVKDLACNSYEDSKTVAEFWKVMNFWSAFYPKDYSSVWNESQLFLVIHDLSMTCPWPVIKLPVLKCSNIYFARIFFTSVQMIIENSGKVERRRVALSVSHQPLVNYAWSYKGIDCSWWSCSTYIVSVFWFSFNTRSTHPESVHLNFKHGSN